MRTLVIAVAVAGLLSACGSRETAGTSATDAAETTGPASEANVAPPLKPAVPSATDPTAGAPIPSTPPIVSPSEAQTSTLSLDTAPAMPPR